MPNWVYNGLTIEGKPNLIKEVKEQLGRSYSYPVLDFASGEVKEETNESPFSYWNIIRPTDMDAYAQQPVRSELPVNDPNWWEDVQEKSKTDNSWYNWNHRNWGCKWDASNVELVDNENNGDNGVLFYRFESPWSPPVPALIKLSEQYPTLLLTLEYEEENGWGGEMEIRCGEIISDDQYGSKCPDCDENDTMEYCEDCENDVCSSCNFGAEDVCDTHKEELTNGVL